MGSTGLQLLGWAVCQSVWVIGLGSIRLSLGCPSVCWAFVWPHCPPGSLLSGFTLSLGCPGCWVVIGFVWVTGHGLGWAGCRLPPVWLSVIATVHWVRHWLGRPSFNCLGCHISSPGFNCLGLGLVGWLGYWVVCPLGWLLGLFKAVNNFRLSGLTGFRPTKPLATVFVWGHNQRPSITSHNKLPVWAIVRPIPINWLIRLSVWLTVCQYWVVCLPRLGLLSGFIAGLSVTGPGCLLSVSLLSVQCLGLGCLFVCLLSACLSVCFCCLSVCLGCCCQFTGFLLGSRSVCLAGLLGSLFKVCLGYCLGCCLSAGSAPQWATIGLGLASLSVFVKAGFTIWAVWLNVFSIIGFNYNWAGLGLPGSVHCSITNNGFINTLASQLPGLSFVVCHGLGWVWVQYCLGLPVRGCLGCLGLSVCCLSVCPQCHCPLSLGSHLQLSITPPGFTVWAVIGLNCLGQFLGHCCLPVCLSPGSVCCLSVSNWVRLRLSVNNCCQSHSTNTILGLAGLGSACWVGFATAGSNFVCPTSGLSPRGHWAARCLAVRLSVQLGWVQLPAVHWATVRPFTPPGSGSAVCPGSGLPAGLPAVRQAVVRLGHSSVQELGLGCLGCLSSRLGCLLSGYCPFRLINWVANQSATGLLGCQYCGSVWAGWVNWVTSLGWAVCCLGLAGLGSLPVCWAGSGLPTVWAGLGQLATGLGQLGCLRPLSARLPAVSWAVRATPISPLGSSVQLPIGSVCCLGWAVRHCPPVWAVRLGLANCPLLSVRLHTTWVVRCLGHSQSVFNTNCPPGLLRLAVCLSVRLGSVCHFRPSANVRFVVWASSIVHGSAVWVRCLLAGLGCLLTIAHWVVRLSGFRSVCLGSSAVCLSVQGCLGHWVGWVVQGCSSVMLSAPFHCHLLLSGFACLGCHWVLLLLSAPIFLGSSAVCCSSVWVHHLGSHCLLLSVCLLSAWVNVGLGVHCLGSAFVWVWAWLRLSVCWLVWLSVSSVCQLLLQLSTVCLAVCHCLGQFSWVVHFSGCQSHQLGCPSATGLSGSAVWSLGWAVCLATGLGLGCLSGLGLAWVQSNWVVLGCLG